MLFGVAYSTQTEDGITRTGVTGENGDPGRFSYFMDVRNLILSEKTLDWAYIERWAQKLSVVDLLNEVRSENV